jgi:hypothetical protein
MHTPPPKEENRLSMKQVTDKEITFRGSAVVKRRSLLQSRNSSGSSKHSITRIIKIT